jgi:two-component system response regulator DesR
MRVLLADSRDIAQLGFRELLADEPWVERFMAARSAAQTLLLARDHRPHVAILGASHSAQGATELCGRLSEQVPSTRVLLVSSEPISTRRARAVGAAGTVPSTWRGHEITGAARVIGLGMSVFAAEADRPGLTLTGREMEVLELIGSGATNREIAEHLGLSPNTVKEHASTLYRKVKARNRAEAIIRAQQLGLLE